MSTALNTGGLLPNSSPYGADYSPSGAGSTASVAPGFFAAHTSIVDWVQIELRLTRVGNPIVKVSCLIDEDGNLIATDGSTEITVPVVAGNYYFSINTETI